MNKMKIQTSNIYIGRPDKSKYFNSKNTNTNPFDLLDQISSDHQSDQIKKSNDYSIPPIHKINWKIGILDGMSWADAVGA